MKLRIKKYFRINAPFYNVECLVDGSWLSVCATACDNKELALVLKNACLKAIEEGVPVWFSKDNIKHKDTDP